MNAPKNTPQLPHRLQPIWLDDLLGLWSSSALSSSNLGFSSVSPMFARMGEPDCVDAEASFSALELRVAAEAVDRLRIEYADEWAALRLHLHPRRRTLPTPQDRPLAASSGLQATTLAEYVPRPILTPANPPVGLLESAARRLASWIDEAMDSF